MLLYARENTGMDKMGTLPLKGLWFREEEIFLIRLNG